MSSKSVKRKITRWKDFCCVFLMTCYSDGIESESGNNKAGNGRKKVEMKVKGIRVLVERGTISNSTVHKGLSVEAENETGSCKGGVRVHTNRVPKALYAPVQKASNALWKHYTVDSKTNVAREESLGWRVIPVSQWEAWLTKWNELHTVYVGSVLTFCQQAEQGKLVPALAAETRKAAEEIIREGKIPTAKFIRERLLDDEGKMTMYVDVDMSHPRIRKAVEGLTEEIRDSLLKAREASVEAADRRFERRYMVNRLTAIQAYLMDLVVRCGRENVKGTKFATLCTKHDRLLALEGEGIIESEALNITFKRIRDEIGETLSNDSLVDNPDYRAKCVESAGKILTGMADLFAADLLEESRTGADVILANESKRKDKEPATVTTDATEPTEPEATATPDDGCGIDL